MSVGGSEGGDIAALDARLAALERRVELLEAGGAGETSQFADRFDVYLSDPGWHPIRLIKLVRVLTGMGLEEAKNLISSPPGLIKAEVSRDEAESIRVQIEELGASVEIK